MWRRAARPRSELQRRVRAANHGRRTVCRVCRKRAKPEQTRFGCFFRFLRFFLYRVHPRKTLATTIRGRRDAVCSHVLDWYEHACSVYGSRRGTECTDCRAGRGGGDSRALLVLSLSAVEMRWQWWRWLAV